MSNDHHTQLVVFSLYFNVAVIGVSVDQAEFVVGIAVDDTDEKVLEEGLEQCMLLLLLV